MCYAGAYKQGNRRRYFAWTGLVVYDSIGLGPVNVDSQAGHESRQQGPPYDVLVFTAAVTEICHYHGHVKGLGAYFLLKDAKSNSFIKCMCFV